jgi:hypothetical protein
MVQLIESNAIESRTDRLTAIPFNSGLASVTFTRPIAPEIRTCVTFKSLPADYITTAPFSVNRPLSAAATKKQGAADRQLESGG